MNNTKYTIGVDFGTESGRAVLVEVATGREAGGYDSIFEAVPHMARLKEETFKPIRENAAAYNALYAEYVRLHDYFGRGENDVMKTLKRIKADGKRRGAGILPAGVGGVPQNPSIL
jgi:ribulose kinase